MRGIVQPSGVRPDTSRTLIQECVRYEARDGCLSPAIPSGYDTSEAREAAIDFENVAWQATDSMSPALRDIIMESAWYRAVWFITMCLTSDLLLTTIGDRRVT